MLCIPGFDSKQHHKSFAAPGRASSLYCSHASEVPSQHHIPKPICNGMYNISENFCHEKYTMNQSPAKT